MLPRSQRQEALSRSYVRAIAAHAGILCGEPDLDFGIDMVLRVVELRGQQYWDTGPQLDLQLKSTTRAEVREAEVVYDLEVRAYNLLRENIVHGRPRILVVFVMPDDEAQWLSQSVEELTLRRCAYWRSLRGAEATTAQTTIRIAIPRTQVFSVEALNRLMDLVRQGGMP